MKHINVIFLLYLLTQNLCGQTNGFNTQQADTTIYLTVDKDPTFPGDTLLSFLHRNIIYPPIDRSQTTGMIYVEFVVETNGQISNAKITKGLHPTYDNEVLRVINSMPNWTTGYKNGIAVRTKRIIPIRIHLQ
ncbi:MAG: energy transducer TonB [Bacteroidetes bacterium]|nr:energy transducer TonB [Bacteroidota bacterium]